MAQEHFLRREIVCLFFFVIFLQNIDLAFGAIQGKMEDCGGVIVTSKQLAIMLIAKSLRSCFFLS